MLSTSSLIAIAVVLSVFALVVSISARFFCRDAVQWLSESNARSTSLRKLTEIEAEMAEITDSVFSLHESLKKLRGRQSMRELRQRRKEAETDAQATDHDLNTQEGRDAARAELEAELAKSGKLTPRIHINGA